MVLSFVPSRWMEQHARASNASKYEIQRSVVVVVVVAACPRRRVVIGGQVSLLPFVNPLLFWFVPSPSFIHLSFRRSRSTKGENTSINQSRGPRLMGVLEMVDCRPVFSFHKCNFLASRIRFFWCRSSSWKGFSKSCFNFCRG